MPFCRIWQRSNNFRGDNITSGWSALNGQTQSAYIQGGVKPREMRLGHTVKLVQNMFTRALLTRYYRLQVVLLRARPWEFLQATAPYLLAPKQMDLFAHLHLVLPCTV